MGGKFSTGVQQTCRKCDEKTESYCVLAFSVVNRFIRSGAKLNDFAFTRATHV